MTDREDQAAMARERAETIAREADREACEAVQRIATEAGAQAVEEPMGPVTLRRVDSATGLRAARWLALTAGGQLRSYTRYAREDGIGWQEIGALLELGADAAECGLRVDETAFGLAAGHPSGRGQVAVFTWRCRDCGQVIYDHGPGHGRPEDDERGHARDCARLAAAIAEFDAAWTPDG